MNKILVLLLPITFALTGCATYDKQIETLETRIAALENQVSPQQQKTPSEEVKPVSEIKTISSAEIIIPETPTKKDIQAALKNSGYYEGEVDGKTGPRTKKAIEDFQKANDLIADGKVGPNTWTKLKTHLAASTTETAQSVTTATETTKE